MQCSSSVSQELCFLQGSYPCLPSPHMCNVWVCRKQKDNQDTRPGLLQANCGKASSSIPIMETSSIIQEVKEPELARTTLNTLKAHFRACEEGNAEKGPPPSLTCYLIRNGWRLNSLPRKEDRFWGQIKRQCLWGMRGPGPLQHHLDLLQLHEISICIVQARPKCTCLRLVAIPMVHEVHRANVPLPHRLMKCTMHSPSQISSVSPSN